MTADDVLATLALRGACVSRKGGNLLIAPRTAVDPDLLAALKEHKADLLARLTAGQEGQDSQGGQHSTVGHLGHLAFQDPSAAFDALASRALAEVAKRHVPGALAWVSEHRLDLSREIADAEKAIGGLERWRPYGPEQLAGLRAALIRWFRAQSAGLDAFAGRHLAP